MSPALLSTLTATTPLTIAGVVQDPSGKWPAALGSVLVLESDAAYRLLTAPLLNALQFNVSVAQLLVSRSGSASLSPAQSRAWDGAKQMNE